MRRSSEKTIGSFKTLGAVPRVLRVACFQAAEECRSASATASPSLKTNVSSSYSDQRSDPHEASRTWLERMETCIRLFTEFLSAADDARTLVLRDMTCVDCLFRLFWEESVRNYVLQHILHLVKVHLRTNVYLIYSSCVDSTMAIEFA